MGKMKPPSNNRIRPIPVWIRYAPVARSKPEPVLSRENRYSALSTAVGNNCPYQQHSRMSLSLCQKLVAHLRKKTEKA